MSFTAPKFTNVGKQLQARALAGDSLTFTKIQMGDGALAGGSIAALTSLVHNVVSVDVIGAQRTGETATVKGAFTNAGLTTGFYWREIGLFAADPDFPNDRSKDILYCYQNAGDLAEYIPAASSELVEKVIAMGAVVGDAQTVNAVMASLDYALNDDLNDHVNDQSNPHGVTAAQVGARPDTWTPTASDIGAVPVQDLTAQNPDFNNLVVSGRLRMYEVSSCAESDIGVYHRPVYNAGILLTNGIGGRSQLFIQSGSESMWRRWGSAAGAWNAWVMVYDTAHKPTAADVGALPVGGKAADSAKFDGYSQDVMTENTTDTWVPVYHGNTLQHRAIPLAYNNAPSTLSVNYANTAGSAAPTAHNHAASDINSGTLGVARGGTGKANWAANRLVYPSAATTLAQMSFPSVAGSVLRQNTSGAPYWTSIADLATALGAAKIATGEYTGNGGYQQQNAITLNFNFTPKFVIVGTISNRSVDQYSLMILGSGGAMYSSNMSGTLGYGNVVTISTNSISWYSYQSAAGQGNTANTRYQYYAVG